MPAVGFMCEKKGPVSFEECLACASTWKNPCDFTYPMIVQMVKGLERERHSVTVTNLTGCLRKEILARKLDYHIPLAEEYWRFRGTIAHEIVAGLAMEAYDVAEMVDKGDRTELKLKGDDYLIEKRLHMKFVHEGEEYPLSGQMDLVVIPEKRLVDYKTAKSVPKYKSPYSNHSTQVNLYRRLCLANGIDIDTMEIVYMDMSQCKRLEAQIWPIKRVDRFLVDRLVPLWHAIWADTIPRKPESKDEGLWMCENYCDPVMADECKRLVRIEVEADIVKQKCVQCPYRQKARGKVLEWENEHGQSVAEQVIDEHDYVGDLPGQGE